MNPRRTNFVLWSAAAVLAASAVAALLIGFAMPLDSEPAPDAMRPQVGALKPQPDGVKAGQSDAVSQSDFDRIGSLRLRRHLTEPTAVEQAAADAAAPPQAPATGPLPITLVGTIGDSLAMLQTPGGPVELKGVGEVLADMTVIAIAPARVEMRYNGRTITLVKAADQISQTPSYIRDGGTMRDAEATGDVGPAARMP